MLDLTKKIMPSSVEVDGVFYPINTDFQYWVNFAIKQQNGELENYDDVLFLFSDPKKIPYNAVEAIKKIKEFANPPRILPRPSSGGTSEILLDFEVDADLIYAAILEQYGVDILDEKLHLHYWKFCALLSGLHGDTKLDKVMGYRGFNPNDKTDYNASMSELQKMWRIERKLTPAEQTALDEFDALLK